MSIFLLGFYVFLRKAKYRVIAHKIALQEVQITRNTLAKNLYTKKDLQAQYPEMYHLLFRLGHNMNVDVEAFVNSIEIIGVHDNKRKVGSVEHVRFEQELRTLIEQDPYFFDEYFAFYLRVFKVKKPLAFFIVKTKILCVCCWNVHKNLSDDRVKRLQPRLYVLGLETRLEQLLENQWREAIKCRNNPHILVFM